MLTSSAYHLELEEGCLLLVGGGLDEREYADVLGQTYDCDENFVARPLEGARVLMPDPRGSNSGDAQYYHDALEDVAAEELGAHEGVEQHQQVD